MPAFQEKNPVSQPPLAPSVGEIRFVGSGLAGSLDGVPDDLKRRLPDAVVDELLAGAERGGARRARRGARAADQAAGGAALRSS